MASKKKIVYLVLRLNYIISFNRNRKDLFKEKFDTNLPYNKHMNIFPHGHERKATNQLVVRNTT